MGRDFKRVGVIGLGAMGAGIVEVFAKAGLSVVGVDGTPELAQRGRGFLEGSTGRAVQRGRLSQEDQQELLDRVTWSHQLTDLADVDLVIEAVPERMDIKRAIFAQLDDIVAEDAVLASNTSSLSLTELAAATRHPQRVIGMHFFNPAPVLKLVEVITTLLMQEDLAQDIRALAERLGKRPVIVGDRAGFVANALLITYLARAIRLFEAGHLSRTDLDNAGRVGIGLPMGPLTLADLIGLDVVKEVCDVLYAATHDPAAAPPALLQQMVTAGRLGRKTGSGFYTYEKAGSGAVVTDDGETPVGSPAGTAAAHVEPGVAAASVAVVGDDELAGQIVTQLKGSGAAVTAFTGRAADASALAGTSLVVLVGSDEGCAGECAEDGGECGSGGASSTAWFASVVEALDARTIVVPTDDPSSFAADACVAEDMAVIPAHLHVPTKGGQLVEIARRLDSPPAAVATVRATMEAAGLTPVTARDRAGLVVDALLFPHLNDAVAMLDSGYASAQDIDTAMTAGCGYPQGPFAMLDEIGAIEVAAGLAQMREATGEPALTPAPLLVEHAALERPFLG